MTSANNIQTCTITCYCNQTCEQRQFRCLSRERLLQATKSQSNFLFVYYTNSFFLIVKRYFISLLKERDFCSNFPTLTNVFFTSIQFIFFLINFYFFCRVKYFLHYIIQTILFYLRFKTFTHSYYYNHYKHQNMHTQSRSTYINHL